MKILALVTEAYRGFGGIAQYNRDLIEALAGSDRVENIRILPRLANGPLGPTPSKASQSDALLQRHLYALKALGEALRLRPDLIFCGHLYMAPLARHLAKLNGSQLVVQMHGTEIWKKPSRAQGFALEQADAILCVSRHTRAQVLSFTRSNPNRVVVVPNTFGNDYRPGDGVAMRSQLGLRDEFVLLTVGRLDNRDGYKGHDRVIDALAKLNTSRPILYLISGDGADKERLEARVASRGVADRVRFIGFTPRDKLPDLYRAADLFVMPSGGEGFGIVFLEAMASGTPALGLAIGGAPDPLDFGEWGRAVTTDQVASAITETMARPPPDPAEMHEAVKARFGSGVFARQIVSQIAERFTSSVLPSQY